MSDGGKNLDPDLWTATRGQASFQSAEEALEILVTLKEAEFGDTFTNRDTELDSEENDGISIIFSHDDNYNRLSLSTDSNNQLKLLLVLQEDYVDEASEVINTLLEYVPPLTIEERTVIKRYERPFESLGIPIDDDFDLDMIGIRIKHKGIDYIIQEDEDDSIRVTATDENDTILEEATEEAFLLENIELADEFVNEVL